jgi:endogenous inhibitor of DNA gyrase (YacG/DUF329 family)
MSGTARSHRIVTCPACKGDSVYGPDNPFRPFCSERCKNLDLGAWASESYRLKAKPSESDNDLPDDGGPGEPH